MQYEKTGDNEYVIVLDRGDSISAGILDFCEKESVRTAFYWGIGAASKITLGSYLFGQKKYLTREFAGDIEILSLKGNVTIKEGKPALHAHVVCGLEDYSCFGGHLFDGTISVTLELRLTVPPSGNVICRKPDEETGLSLIALGEKD